MGGNRFVPRNYTTRPGMFGKTPDIPWQIPEGGTDVLLLAAQIQHYLCLRITDAISTSDHRNRASYTRAIGGDDEDEQERAYERLSRILRGENLLRLDDIATAQHHFGDQIDMPDWTVTWNV